MEALFPLCARADKFRARTLYFLGRSPPLTYQERFRVCLMACQRRDPGGHLATRPPLLMSSEAESGEEANSSA